MQRATPDRQLRRPTSVATAMAVVAVCALGASACRRDGTEGTVTSASASASAPTVTEAAAPPASQGLSSVAAKAPDGRPMLGVTAFSTIVYAEPRDTSKRLGYLRVGARVPRSDEPVSTKGCAGAKKEGGGWYEIFPRGFVCAGDDATVDME
jgi:hypothetical protein